MFADAFIFNNIHFFRFVKTANISGKKRKRSEVVDDTENHETRKKSSTRYGQNQDCYGCVAFEPSLPENETEETQVQKKRLLLNYKASNEGTPEEIEILMSDTYPSQRILLNKRDVNKTPLKDILKNH